MPFETSPQIHRIDIKSSGNNLCVFTNSIGINSIFPLMETNAQSVWDSEL